MVFRANVWFYLPIQRRVEGGNLSDISLETEH